MIKKSVLEKLLGEIYRHPDQRNVFGYLTELSAFKGIFSVMRELIETVPVFRTFLQNQLQDQYFPFEQLIRFLRNVLNHTSSSGVILKAEDFEKQLEFLLSPRIQSPIISFNFNYSRYIRHWKGSEEYGIQLELDFTKLKSGMTLESLIDWHQLYLLAELCYNLSQIAEAGKKTVSNTVSRSPSRPKKSSSRSSRSSSRATRTKSQRSFPSSSISNLKKKSSPPRPKSSKSSLKKDKE